MTRARRALVWLAVLAAATQVAFAAAVEADLGGVRDPIARLKWDRLHARPSACRTVMLGSSRTLHGFRPDQFDAAAFNFGLPAAGPIRAGLVWRQLCAAGFRPRLLIVEILPALLAEPSPGRVSEEAWLTPGQLAGADLFRISPYLDHAGRGARVWLAARLNPLATCRHWIDPDPPPAELAGMDAAGWQPYRQAVIADGDRDALTAAQLRQFGPTLRDFKLGAGPTGALRDLLADARQRGVATVLVLMPEGTAFRSLGTNRVLAEFLAEVAREFACPLIDARAWLPDGAFRDGHHLLPDAAGEFTRRLRTEVVTHAG